MSLPQPPRVAEPRFDDWMFRLWKSLTGEGQDDVAADPDAAPAADHSLLSNLDTASYSHLTEANRNLLIGQANTTLHHHRDDRNRAVHFGTQSASTIADFDAAVLALMTSSSSASDPLESQIFGG